MVVLGCASKGMRALAHTHKYIFKKIRKSDKRGNGLSYAMSIDPHPRTGTAEHKAMALSSQAQALSQTSLIALKVRQKEVLLQGYNLPWEPGELRSRTRNIINTHLR